MNPKKALASAWRSRKLSQRAKKVGLRLHQRSDIEFLGTDYGGYAIPTGLIGEGDVCYSAGAGEDISFEIALAERFSAVVGIFDPTPRAVAHFAALQAAAQSGGTVPINGDPAHTYSISAAAMDRLVFRPYGIWSKDETQRFYAPQDASHVSHSILNLQKTEAYFDARCVTLTAAMAELGHDRLRLLKLNIEAAEYAVLRSMVERSIAVDVLCVTFDEFHTQLDADATGRIRDAVAALTATGLRAVAMDESRVTFVAQEHLPP